MPCACVFRPENSLQEKLLSFIMWVVPRSQTGHPSVLVMCLYLLSNLANLLQNVCSTMQVSCICYVAELFNYVKMYYIVCIAQYLCNYVKIYCTSLIM